MVKSSWGGVRPGAGRKANPISKAAVESLKRELWNQQKRTGRRWEQCLAELAYLPLGTPEEIKVNGPLRATAIKLIADLVVENKGEVSVRVNC